MRSIELFAGAGGLALGLAQAGFQHLAVVERDSHSCKTLRDNRSRIHAMAEWEILQEDVRRLDFSQFPEDLDLLSGGVPCQPFSIGGKHKGHQDARNMFPEMLRAILAIRPKAVLIENVKGLTRKTFAEYYSFLLLALSYPEIATYDSLHWREALRNLERHHTSGARGGLEYKVVPELINAADFGVPQKRERVVFVAIRSDLKREFSFPGSTHSKLALDRSKSATSNYWRRHGIACKVMSNDLALDVSPEQFELPMHLPWETVRDAISDLPVPTESRRPEDDFCHFRIRGARTYAGHTGSCLDQPAKTLKAGDHGVPGGENMIRYPNGAVRYFTIRESARLQTFPDEFTFPGSWTETMRQLGNAVPVRLAQVLGSALYATLATTNTHGDSPVQSPRQVQSGS